MTPGEIAIRLALQDEYELVSDHYKHCGYKGGLQPGDKVVIAIDTQIIGAVRICDENGAKVLRGLYIRPEFQRKGIGGRMLAYLKLNVEMDGCYCLPYRHLKKFYSIIDFEEVNAEAAPRFLAERFQRYVSAGGKDVIIMQIKNRPNDL